VSEAIGLNLIGTGTEDSMGMVWAKAKRLSSIAHLSFIVGRSSGLPEPTDMASKARYDERDCEKATHGCMTCINNKGVSTCRIGNP